MQNLPSFIAQHWLLIGAFVIVVIAIFIEEYRAQHGGVKRLHPKDAVLKMNRESALILDVRSSELFQKSHIRHAVNIPVADFELQSKKIEKLKNNPVILCCSIGNMATQAVQKLQKAGVTDIAVLAGGLDAWTRDGLPTAKGE